MTVREWFRLQRGDMWARDSRVGVSEPRAADIDRVGYLITFAHSTPPIDQVSACYGIIREADWTARQQALPQAATVIAAVIRSVNPSPAEAAKIARIRKLMRGVTD